MSRSQDQRLREASLEAVESAARRMVAEAVVRVPKLLRRASRLADKARDPDSVRAVHQLRVAVRRAEAALSAFSEVVSRKHVRKLRRRLRTVRRIAGGPRDLDVLIELLSAPIRWPHEGEAAAAMSLRKRAITARREFLAELDTLAGNSPREEWERLTARVSDKIDGSRVGESAVGKLARRIVREAADRVIAAGNRNLHDLERLHELRLRLKRLRYTIELFLPLSVPECAKPLLASLATLQQALGRASDAVRVCIECRRARDDGAQPVAGLVSLLHRHEEALRAAHDAAIGAWLRLSQGGFFSRLDEAFGGGLTAPLVHSRPIAGSQAEPKPPAPSPGPASVNGYLARPGRSRTHRRRLAAIDVGTNSTRLIVAEASSDGSYRVLDDEKEITRLGRGLDATRRLDPACIEHTASAVARMKTIAEGYGVERVSVVATAAAREAVNGGDLVTAIREKSGLAAEIISADQEAVLAYRSAANAFDLSSRPAVVIDLGGGSTEVVLSIGREAAHGSPSASAVIERIYTIPLGAVRLTERFGGAEAAASVRYREMRSYVKSVIRQHLGRRGLPVAPQLVIGTGGTFTTLAAMVRAMSASEGGSLADSVRAGHDSSAGLFEGGIQGAIITRAEVRHLLEFLRKLPVRERARVPGLPSDRADIIVAGLCVIDVMLRELGCNAARAHEGGIRDGILLSMVREHEQPGASDVPGPPVRVEPLKSIRKFARACGFEQAHSMHVARLSLQIFDQIRQRLAPAMREHGIDATRARRLLEAAAILHDIGYLINYTAHHKHAYHLIVHADLPGWNIDDVHVIANVARYHRRAEPTRRHRAFSLLPAADRFLVRALSGILRIADCFDRSHMQQVRSVRVTENDRDLFFTIDAVGTPDVDLWGAARKAGLLESTLDAVAHFESPRPSPAAAEAVSRSASARPRAIPPVLAGAERSM